MVLKKTTVNKLNGEALMVVRLLCQPVKTSYRCILLILDRPVHLADNPFFKERVYYRKEMDPSPRWKRKDELMLSGIKVIRVNITMYIQAKL